MFSKWYAAAILFILLSVALGVLNFGVDATKGNFFVLMGFIISLILTGITLVGSWLMYSSEKENKQM